MKAISIFIILIFSLVANAAREWQSVDIPNAFCADGSSYRVFIDLRNPKKLGMKMQGGSACWSYFTCFFMELTPTKVPSTIRETQGLLSDSSKVSPVSDYSFVFFPYCTGDVHLGSHKASYDGYDFLHSGKSNVETALEYLSQQGILNFNEVDDFLLYGVSAGALGALYHIMTVSPYVTYSSNKRMLLDSPGLHFGRDFWAKFSDALFEDYSSAIGETGFPLDKESGIIAGVVKNICEAYPEWQVGVLQATRDSVMSTIFGNTSASQHEKDIFSDQGIHSLTESPSDNCSSFLPRSKKHVFLQSEEGSGVEAGGVSAMEFAASLIFNGAGPNYTSR